VTVVASATDWANFFALRCHTAAQPEFQKIACMMRDALAASSPERIGAGGDRCPWHLPFVDPADRDSLMDGKATVEELKLISAGRCARVSYLTHDGRRDERADIALAERLVAETPRHASPLEHVATPAPGRCGNFTGWRQFRYEVANHYVPG
jgi:thymidylate synthase ThyX